MGDNLEAVSGSDVGNNLGVENGLDVESISQRDSLVGKVTCSLLRP